MVLAGTAEHELALGEPADRRADLIHIDLAGSGVHAIEQTAAAVGLQPADHPGTRVDSAL